MESQNSSWLSNSTSIFSLKDTLQFVGGIYLSFTMASSIVLNGLLLLVFVRFEKIRTPINNVMFVTTAVNLFGCTQFPFIIYSHFVHKWVFAKKLCFLSAFIVYFVGCSQIYFMCVISFMKYYMLKEQVNEASIQMFHVKLSVGFVLFLSFYWPTMPLRGWSRYSLEDNLVSCSVEYKERSFSVISYNVCMFMFVFIIPFGFIFHCARKSYLILEGLKKLPCLSKETKRLHSIQKENKISSLIYIGGYLLTWGPYGCVSIYNAFYEHANDTNPITTDAAVVLATSSVLWSTLIILVGNKAIRNKLNRKLFKKHVPEPEPGPETFAEWSMVLMNKTTKRFELELLNICDQLNLTDVFIK